jgi:hypothetical protein
MKRWLNVPLAAMVFLRNFFRIEATKRERKRKRLALFFGVIMVSGMLAAGYTVAYARCHNIISETPVTAFALNVTDNEAVLTYLGKDYVLKLPAKD